MANKKKRKPQPRPTARPPPQHPSGQGRCQPCSAGAQGAGDERPGKPNASRASRSAALRRAAIFTGVGLAAFGVLWWFQRASAPRPLPQAATNAIQAASCRYDTGPSDETAGGQHLDDGVSTTYPSVPATAGAHDPVPLPSAPRVYEEPVPDTRAVHFLEHSGVIAYYRPGEAGPGQPVIDRLTQLANDSKNTIVAPLDALPQDTAFSVTAWNKVVNCGPDITPEQARSDHQRIRGSLRVHQQRARARAGRGLLSAAQDTEHPPAPQLMEPCWNVAVEPPPPPCTREVGNPREPVAAPRRRYSFRTAPHKAWAPLPGRA